jgi:hypothetical protein
LNNLGLCGGLTHLCKILRLDNLTGLDEIEVMKLGPPSARKLMTYRYSVCVLCTVASVFLFIAGHSIVKNPVITAYDYVIILVIVVALYVENQVGPFVS